MNWTNLKSLLRSRAVRLAITIALAAALYYAADWSAVVAALARLDRAYLAAAMLLFVPQTIVSALRWRCIVSRYAPISLAEAVRHTLLASAANLALPSKLGDFSKGAMLPADHTRAASVAPRLVLLEKVADVAALLTVLVLGFAGAPWYIILAVALVLALLARVVPVTEKLTIRRDLIGVAATSALLWCLHVWQIDLFLRSAGVFVTSDVAAARIPLALFAGVIPLSLWGVGTRDAALMALFADVASPALLAAVGMLTALRYLVPGACGVLLLARRSASRASVEPTTSVDTAAVLSPAAVASSR